MIRSPWSDQKVSERSGHNSVALPTSEGWREGDRIGPDPSETFRSLHSTAVPWRKLALIITFFYDFYIHLIEKSAYRLQRNF